MNLLVIGGTHFVGRHVLVEAARRGHDVTVFHRGLAEPGDGFPSVEHLHGDRDGELGPLRGRRWEAVIDTCGYVPRVVRASAGLLAEAAGHYTFVSSLSAYPDDVPAGATERTPTHGPPLPETEEITAESYGRLKVACEREAQRAFPGATSIVRPGFIVGPHDSNDRFASYVRRAAEGGRMLAPEPRNGPVQLVDARDLAAFMIDHAEGANAEVFNVTGPDRPLTMQELLEACIRAGNADTELAWVGEEFLRRHGVNEGEPIGERLEDLPYWYPREEGFAAIDVSKAIGAGLRFRTLAETISDTLEWDRARDRRRPLMAGLPPEREGELLDGWAAEA